MKEETKAGKPCKYDEYYELRLKSLEKEIDDLRRKQEEMAQEYVKIFIDHTREIAKLGANLDYALEKAKSR